MDETMIRRLIGAALDARETAYAPYSHYCVGAALLTASGRIYTGGNIENASYGATCCAEQNAVFRAVNDGEREFDAIAVAGGLKGEDPVDYAFPCGICRQVMQEFMRRDFLIIVARSTEDYRRYTLEELLPAGFGGSSIV